MSDAQANALASMLCLQVFMLTAEISKRSAGLLPPVCLRSQVCAVQAYTVDSRRLTHTLTSSSLRAGNGGECTSPPKPRPRKKERVLDLRTMCAVVANGKTTPCLRPLHCKVNKRAPHVQRARRRKRDGGERGRWKERATGGREMNT